MPTLNETGFTAWNWLFSNLKMFNGRAADKKSQPQFWIEKLRQPEATAGTF